MSFIYNFHLDLTFVFHNFVLRRSKLSRAEHHTLFAHVEPICTLSSSLYVKVSFFFLYWFLTKVSIQTLLAIQIKRDDWFDNACAQEEFSSEGRGGWCVQQWAPPCMWGMPDCQVVMPQYRVGNITLRTPNLSQASVLLYQCR